MATDEAEDDGRVTLHDIAPRLARARDQELAYRERRRRAIISLTDATEAVTRSMRGLEKHAGKAAERMAEFQRASEASQARGSPARRTSS
jgi:hypothetical protein